MLVKHLSKFQTEIAILRKYSIIKKSLQNNRDNIVMFLECKKK